MASRIRGRGYETKSTRRTLYPKVNPVRVLLINQVFHPDPQATGQYLSCVAEALVKRGHEVTVMTGRRCYDDPAVVYPPRETWHGIEILRIWTSACGHGSKLARAVDFLTFLMSAALRCLILPRADVVMALTTPPLVSVLGAALAKIWRGRFIYWVMDLNPDEAIAVGWLDPHGLPARVLDGASRWSLRHADRIIVLDDYMRARVVAKGIAPEKIETVPIWTHAAVRFDADGRARFRTEHGLADKFVVMYSGNHTPCHPLDTLVDAAALLRDVPQIHFCFVGGGIEWKHLAARARNEKWPNASFIGYQPFDALSASLSAADVQIVAMGDSFVGIVHPSKVYNFLAVERPFIFIGPERSHIPDLIRDAELLDVATSLRHGESAALAKELRMRFEAFGTKKMAVWPEQVRLARWTESAAVERIVALMENSAEKKVNRG